MLIKAEHSFICRFNTFFGRIEVITSSAGDSFSPTDVSRTKAKLSAAYPST